MAQALVYEDDSAGWRTMVAGDLPASGVAAATYGDATHVAQVAVSSKGVITSASNVAISAGTGTVTSVTAADTSVVVAGTATDPTVATGTLDVIATDHPPAANWSNNSKKITSLANGAGAQDAAAFGQIPTALPPNGAAGGALAGTYPNPTIAASGVTAATYGDSTDVGQFTVSAAGLITAASNVAISGTSGGANLTVLYNSTLGGAAATFDTGAGGFSTSYKHLMIIIIARNTQAVASSTANLTFNNDSGANYDAQTVRGINATASATNNLAATSLGITIPGSSIGSPFAGGCVMFVPAYAGTTFNKTVWALQGFADTSAADGNARSIAGEWRSTAAITRIIFTANAASNFVAGSQVTVYGIG